MEYSPIKDMLEICLKTDDDFLKTKETLQRIGVASKDDKRLYQSCHILHKRGRYFVVHFKELFALDGLPCDINENDIARRNTIVNLLVEWGLVSLPENAPRPTPVVALDQIKILAYREKKDWKLVSKYEIGSARNLHPHTKSVIKETRKFIEADLPNTVHV